MSFEPSGRDPKQEIARLAQLVRCYERVAVLTYGTVVQVPGDTSRIAVIAPTNGVAFTIQNPALPREGVELTLEIFNNTAGALGAITMGTEYQTAGAIVAPAAGKRRLYGFYRTGSNDIAAPKWRETFRSAADI